MSFKFNPKEIIDSINRDLKNDNMDDEQLSSEVVSKEDYERDIQSMEYEIHFLTNIIAIMLERLGNNFLIDQNEILGKVKEFEIYGRI